MRTSHASPPSGSKVECTVPLRTTLLLRARIFNDHWQPTAYTDHFFEVRPTLARTLSVVLTKCNTFLVFLSLAGFSDRGRATGRNRTLLRSFFFRDAFLVLALRCRSYGASFLDTGLLGCAAMPKPFIWTANASDILEKVKRAQCSQIQLCRRFVGSGSGVLHFGVPPVL
jgi:hypothetical protein